MPLVPDCPNGYSAHGGSCYKLVVQQPEDYSFWLTARDACITDNGHLVQIEDNSENSIVSSMAAGYV